MFIANAKKKKNKISLKMTIFHTSTRPHKFILLFVVVLFLLLSISDGRKTSPSISSKKSSVRRQTTTATSSISSSPSMAYNLSVITWNLAEKKPTDQDCLFLQQFRGDDFVVFGVQECENIKPRREEGHRSRAWRAMQKTVLGKTYVCLAQHRMGGMQIAAGKVQGTQILDVACGVGNVLTNKGAVCVLLRIRGKTLALVNAHLAAHVGKVKERNADYRRIISSIITRTQPRWLHKPTVHQHTLTLTTSHRGNNKHGGKYPPSSPLDPLQMGEKYYQSAKKFGETLLNEGFGEELRAQYQPWVNQMKQAMGMSESSSSSTSAVVVVRDGKKGKGKGNGRKSPSSSSSSTSTGGKKSATIIPSRPLTKSTKTKTDMDTEEGLGSVDLIDSLTKKKKRMRGLKLKHPKRSKQLPQSESNKEGLKQGMKAVKGKGKGITGVAGKIGIANDDEVKDEEEEEDEEEMEFDYFPLDAMIFFGDLNYRLDVPRLEVEMVKAALEEAMIGGLDYDIASVGTDDAGAITGMSTTATGTAAVDGSAASMDAMEHLLEHDQLTRERMLGRAFSGFSEGKIGFLPTFKYDKGTDQFDTSGKNRPPAWTDRVLFRMVNPDPLGNDNNNKYKKKKEKSQSQVDKGNGSDDSYTASSSPSATSSTAASSSLLPPVEEMGSPVNSPSQTTAPISSPSQTSSMLQLHRYTSHMESRHSDHRPVSARFILTL